MAGLRASSLAALLALGSLALGSACEPGVSGSRAHAPSAATALVGVAPGAPTSAATTAAEAEGAVDTVVLRPVDPMAVGTSAAGVAKLCDDNLGLARRLVARLEKLDVRPGQPKPLDFENTLGRLDDAFLAISNGSELTYLLGVAHPDEAVRAAARACETKAEELTTSIWLDSALGKVVLAYAATRPALSGERARFLEHALRELKRNGAELAPAAQQRLRQLNAELTTLGQQFVAEISTSVGHIRITPEQLAGMPESYVKAHPLEHDGKITISTDYPDYYPFVTYATDRRAATELYIKFTNRGGDVNLGRLDRLLALRHEKAKLLGYPSWAAYAIEPRMAHTLGDAQAFVDRMDHAVGDAARNERDEFRKELARLKGDVRKPLGPPDLYYLTEQVRKRRFGFDSRELSPYFEIRAVTRGLLELSASLYGLEFKAAPVKAWHDEVIAYDVLAQGRVVGRIYLDLYTRPNKYKHTAMFPIRLGRRFGDGAVQTPEAALLGSFPRPGEPMPHAEVVTLFHEFGHLLHHLLSKAELATYGGTNTAASPSRRSNSCSWPSSICATTPRPLASTPPRCSSRCRKSAGRSPT